MVAISRILAVRTRGADVAAGLETLVASAKRMIRSNVVSVVVLEVVDTGICGTGGCTMFDTGVGEGRY